MLCVKWMKKVFLSFFLQVWAGMTIAKSPHQRSPFHHVESYQCTPTEVSGRNILKDKEGPLPRSMPRCLPAQHEAPVKTPGSSVHLQPELSCHHSPESALEGHGSQGLQPLSKHSKAPNPRWHVIIQQSWLKESPYFFFYPRWILLVKFFPSLSSL